MNATDDVGISQYFINDTEHFSIDAETGIITNATVLQIGEYSLNISVNDTSGNVLSQIITITIQPDTIAPEWVNTPTNQTIFEGDAFIYDINATDNIAIDHYSISDTMNFSIDPSTGIITNATILQYGNYTLIITVTDVNGNELSITITIEVIKENNDKDGLTGGQITLIVVLPIGIGVGTFFVVKKKWHLKAIDKVKNLKIGDKIKNLKIGDKIKNLKKS